METSGHLYGKQHIKNVYNTSKDKHTHTHTLTFLSGECILSVGTPLELVLDLNGSVVVCGGLEAIQGVLHDMH